MPHQLAITIRAQIEDGRRDAVMHVLLDMHHQGAAHNNRIPFAELSGVHFARFFILEETTDLEGRTIPATLCYLADVDAPLRRHLRELAERSGLDSVFGHCADFPGSFGAGGVRDRIAWLHNHMVKAAATYTHTVGRTVRQVHDEARLREALEEHLDQAGDRLPAAPGPAYRELRDFVLGSPELRWAGHPAPRPGFGYRIRNNASLVLVPLAVVALLPLLVPLTIAWLLLIRVRERRDVPESGAPDLGHVREVEQYEDFVAQNPFTAVGFVKPGRVRRITMRTVLFGLSWTNQHFFHRDNLAGVRTIHFARWVPIDEQRRLIFASNYDGSLESYMDDFIDRLAAGLNAVFSNGVGYPSTRWLLFGGARDETAFKHYLRRHQVPTVVWYSAYERLPARNIDNNQRIRAGIVDALGADEDGADEAGAHEADAHENRAAEWLARL